MNRDIHPELGPRRRIMGMEACLVAVRAIHPRAGMEGSTGSERSFWVGRELVAHAWPIREAIEAFWLRVTAAKKDAGSEIKRASGAGTRTGRQEQWP